MLTFTDIFMCTTGGNEETVERMKAWADFLVLHERAKKAEEEQDKSYPKLNRYETDALMFAAGIDRHVRRRRKPRPKVTVRIN